ncbi:hypothetical protein QVD17_35659 [Tagetes erecta]|uniref:Uncharacterized protein n=1 Tax=Tagetes erecta TaxID=13708 RepID=A0AAD8JQY4_TARER|nr:hypothetical protein QVD17_35659 [Tagetes erecta]
MKCSLFLVKQKAFYMIHRLFYVCRDATTHEATFKIKMEKNIAIYKNADEVTQAYYQKRRYPKISISW